MTRDILVLAIFLSFDTSLQSLFRRTDQLNLGMVSLHMSLIPVAIDRDYGTAAYLFAVLYALFKFKRAGSVRARLVAFSNKSETQTSTRPSQVLPSALALCQGEGT